MGLDAGPKWFEVQLPKGAPHTLKQRLAMCHVQLPVNQMHIGFDAGESLAQRIQQRPAVRIIVVGMGIRDLGSGRAASQKQHEGKPDIGNASFIGCDRPARQQLGVWYQLHAL